MKLEDLNVIEDITLLSKEEYKQNEDIIPLINVEGWWLRSHSKHYANDIHFIWGEDGEIDSYGLVAEKALAIRPALQISKSMSLTPGDKLEIFGKSWTVLNDNLVLCDTAINNMLFRKDYNISDANNYETSDIKTYLDNWLNKELEKNGYTAKLIKEPIEQSTSQQDSFKDVTSITTHKDDMFPLKMYLDEDKIFQFKEQFDEFSKITGNYNVYLDSETYIESDLAFKIFPAEKLIFLKRFNNDNNLEDMEHYFSLKEILGEHPAFIDIKEWYDKVEDYRKKEKEIVNKNRIDLKEFKSYNKLDDRQKDMLLNMIHNLEPFQSRTRRLRVPFSEKAVSKWEEDKGVKLPEDYRWFITNVGHEFYPGDEKQTGAYADLDKYYFPDFDPDENSLGYDDYLLFDDYPISYVLGLHDCDYGKILMVHEGDYDMASDVFETPKDYENFIKYLEEHGCVFDSFLEFYKGKLIQAYKKHIKDINIDEENR